MREDLEVEGLIAGWRWDLEAGKSSRVIWGGQILSIGGALVLKSSVSYALDQGLSTRAT